MARYCFSIIICYSVLDSIDLHFPVAASTAAAAQKATVRCVCGKVSLTFTSLEPLVRLECGCRDCRQAREFEATRGGPKSHSPLSTLAYFPNDITLDQSIEDVSEIIEVVTLREGGRSSRLVARCCRSTIAVDHPGYGGKLVMVPEESCILIAAKISPLARIYMGDWDHERDGDPPPTGDWPTLGAGATDADKEVYRYKFREAAVALPREGVSLQEVVAALKPTACLGLTEGQRF